MKVLIKVLWAGYFKNDHNVSIEKIRNPTKEFGNEIILLHGLPVYIKWGLGQKKIG